MEVFYHKDYTFASMLTHLVKMTVFFLLSTGTRYGTIRRQLKRPHPGIWLHTRTSAPPGTWGPGTTPGWQSFLKPHSILSGQGFHEEGVKTPRMPVPGFSPVSTTQKDERF